MACRFKFKNFYFRYFITFNISSFINIFLKPYQKQRILTFLNPENDPTGAGYHVIQSKIAIGSGGFLEKDIRKAHKATYHFYRNHILILYLQLLQNNLVFSEV